ncbi:hypothetical protein O6H91_11G119000 [Diphasiastrum complanatum]|uniref:Uncharacterized protein n=1 Tax=Diphasiastrum complanatum TaxID=34168 RepID=A0ACC2CDB9_DIPCM|nr:hypothetical protein O6H91_11G119000 [Diphasiastrum complanatum]
MTRCSGCKWIAALWLWYLIHFLRWVVVNSQTDPSDLAVLQSLMKGLSNPEVLGWSGNDPCGSWTYIQCQGIRVTGISASGIGLRGMLTQDLNKLSQLQYLGLQKNSLSGPLPSLNGLHAVQIVYLDDNNFDSIPADFFKGLGSLHAIYLDNNNLNASVGWLLPPDLSECKALLNLSLTNTSLSGSIPPYLGSMASLRVLNLAYNKLGGGIPPSFSRSNLVQLQANNMLGPVLTGPIAAVGSMPNLVQLWLQVNKITGIIPEGLSNADTLQDLRLNDNQLTGLIPPNLTSLQLTAFTVQNNQLVGPIPSFNSSVNFLSFGNSFCQSKPGMACALEVTSLLTFISDVGYPFSITSSWAGGNPCVGWQGIACDSSGHVSSINLPSSQLVGTVSRTLADLSSLVNVNLSNNNLTGMIPTELTRLKSLKLLDLSNNDLSGQPPIFPPQVLLKIQGNLQANSTRVPASSPSPQHRPSTLPGAPSQYGAPSASTAPPHSTNFMFAASPPSIPPPQNTNPTSLAPLAVRLNASATSSLEHWPTGSRTRKSSSVFVTTIMGAAVGVSAVLLLAVLAACFLCKKRKKQPVQCSNALTVHPGDSGSDKDTVNVVVATKSLDRSRSGVQSRNSSAPSDVQVVEAGNLVISMQILRSATNNFSEHSILGRGGFGIVYKGVLDDGTSIAVKRMETVMVSSKGLNEFQAEIAVLTKVRHRHLVALLGYCIDGFEKLLVYEYLSNGTLAQHLFEYSKLSWKPLDWKKRLSIALDVARGMEYLHGLAHKSFIHRDLKPSNILIDHKYRAKVSDFGLVKLAPEGKYSVETRVAGTFGYLAPEYAVTGRVTTKADVFSFGVILMELISGRRALDETQSEENLHLIAWFRRLQAAKDTFSKAIDLAMEINSESFQSICTVAELAGHCVAQEPFQRPDMGHVVNVLASLVGTWKPTDQQWEDTVGVDLNMSLPQALIKWQAFEDCTMNSLDDSQRQVINGSGCNMQSYFDPISFQESLFSLIK